MRAFVTGASGFVGHAVCAGLVARGHDVTALVRRPGSEPAGTTAVQGDLGHADPLTHLLEAAAPDCVIHLAAEIATQRDLVPLWLASIAGGGDPARAVVRSARSSNAHIKQELGWAPKFPSAAQGVPDAVAHLPA